MADEYQENSDNSFKESKRSLLKSKGDSDEQRSNESKNSHESSPINIGMTIQQRMEALRKNNEEDWRKRSASNSNDEKPTMASNLVKQQKEQLKQQLNQINLASKSSSNIKRNVLAPFLNEMKANQKHDNCSDDNEESSNKKNRMSQSNESLDSLMHHNQVILDEKPPRRPAGKKKTNITCS